MFYNEICLNQCRGLPNYICMDRDPRFRSAWFREFYRLTGVHLHFTTGYKSQSNLLRAPLRAHPLAPTGTLANAPLKHP